MNKKELIVLIKLEALVTERHAMITFNTERLEKGQTLGYGEEAFVELSQRIDALLKELEE